MSNENKTELEARLEAAHKVADHYRAEKGTRVWHKGDHVRIYGDDRKGCRGYLDVIIKFGGVYFYDKTRGYNRLWCGTIEKFIEPSDEKKV